MRKTAKKKMVIIADSKIFMTWKCTTEGCECDGQEAVVYPDFYQDNGTPVCEGGEDMEYMHTEVELDK